MSRTLMIVDDEQSIRELLVRIVCELYRDRVSSGQMAVRTAKDGGEAIALSRDLSPSLILMDVNMPVADGIDAFYQIKADNNHVPLKTVFITGYGSDSVVRSRIDRAIGDGAIGCLTKPISIAELRKVIDLHVGV